MKNLRFKSQTLCLVLLALSLLLTMGMQCKKEQTGIDALPPATQEGKGTFGCLVNNEVFLPKGNFSSGNPINCAYQFAYMENKYYLAVGASNNSNNLIDLTISYKGTGTNIGIHDLQSSSDNQYSGEYTIYKGGSINNFKTTEVFKGELNITKFDPINQIISGTFWFDAVNDKGEKIEVREGRFDCLFKK